MAATAPAIMGIDPGLDGALVMLVDAACVWQVRICDIAADGWRPGVARLLADHIDDALEQAGALPVVAYIERASTRPGQGAALTTGIGYGLVLGVVAARVRTYEVTPPSWRRAAGFPARPGGPDGRKAAKADAVSWASQVPGLTLMYPRCRTPHEGVADAACIAYAGANLEARKAGEAAP